MLISSFQPEQLEAFIRPGLSHLLSDYIENQQYDRASLVLSAFVDTWPVASIIEVADQRWRSECDPLSLSVLARARQILGFLTASVPELELPRSLPPHTIVAGEELASRRGELSAAAAKGEIVAVFFSSNIPMDPESQLALGEIRMEASAQQAAENYGYAGLLAPTAPLFPETLRHAPSGKIGLSLRRMCDIAELPGTPARLRNGDTRSVGWLLWNGPAQPLPVAGPAFQLVRHIEHGVEVAATRAGLSLEAAQDMVRELVRLGALSSV